MSAEKVTKEKQIRVQYPCSVCVQVSFRLVIQINGTSYVASCKWFQGDEQ